MKEKLIKLINNKDICSVKSPFEKWKDKLQSEKVFVKYNQPIKNHYPEYVKDPNK